jgi:predicted TIM-barrel fold metal-dependent hydrolase
MEGRIVKKSKLAESASRARRAVRRFVQKFEFDEEMNLNLPIPTQVVSNEEYLPYPQTDEQKRVQHHLIRLADHNAKLLGISRRQFLATSGGMAAAFMAMNSVFGKFFDVDASEMIEPTAYDEKWPKNQFIFDIQTHHVSSGRQVLPLLGYRKVAERWNPDLKGHAHKMEDLYLANYIKEIFLDSDTMVAVISGFPSPTDNSNILPPPDMIETRAKINGLAASRRIVSHGLFSPDLGAANMENMHRQAEMLKIEAWKGYTGQGLGPTKEGWWLDDEKVAYPTLEYARKTGIKLVCVHKGLPLPGFNVEHCSPRDVPKAAADFPDLTFILYHSGFKGLESSAEIIKAFQTGDLKITGDPTKDAYVPWVSDICAARKKNPKMKNVYMEIGSTFGMLAITNPMLCCHVLGMLIDAFGDDHILWGTDSIWWGSPQWQIEAFRRLKMDEGLMKQFGYKPLTPEVKNKIFGLNAARVYGVDVKAKLHAIPNDYVTKLKAEYRNDGARPSNTQYGWVYGK